MALKSPLMPSPTGAGIASPYSPYSDSSNSPARFDAHHSHYLHNVSQSNRSSANADSLAPPSPYPQQIEPSPTDSNGTESTEIDEGAQEDVGADRPTKSPAIHNAQVAPPPDGEVTSPDTRLPPPRLNTVSAARAHADSTDEAPASVIHVPSGFRNLDASGTKSPPIDTNHSIASPVTPEPITGTLEEKRPTTALDVDTAVPRYADRSTPRAQKREDLMEESRRHSSRHPSLEDIPEALDKDGHENVHVPATLGSDSEISLSAQSSIPEQADEDVAALQTALAECWTLCNTLAGLSSGHRQRTFKFTGRAEVQEQAWLSCWRLCQQLYDHKDEDHASQLGLTLELCRDFCQSLFDARQRLDEVADSVLRVSFELNNHLYNTHGRTLPDAFNERTLDFYITLCHRLMRQRTSLPHETDALLRACWFLAEMLFNLRQSRQEGRPADEELLGSAIQACWELCDLFREGWTQVRPDRATPRPSQQLFNSHVAISFRSGSSASGGHSTSSTASNRQYHDTIPVPPETPITIFDDTSTADSSPDGPNVPNILVLGPANVSGNSSMHNALRGAGGSSAPHHDRWSSNASSTSEDFSESAKSGTSSQRSGSTATASGEDAQLLRLRCLLLKAGMNTGFVRTSGQQLPAHVNSLPDDAFGPQAWQKKILSLYRKLVVNDKTMQTVHTLPIRRLTAAEAAEAVRWLGSSEQWAWMRDLFRLVYGFGIDDAKRRSVAFQV